MRELETVREALGFIECAVSLLEESQTEDTFQRASSIILRSTAIARDALNDALLDKHTQQEILRGMI